MGMRNSNKHDKKNQENNLLGYFIGRFVRE